MSTPCVHIIGAGLAGLSAAVRLSGGGRKIIIHELARHAGGRCRSYFEPALGMTIDNGNHLLLSANHEALAFLKKIGAEHLLPLPDSAEFNFVELESGDRWILRPNSGRIPWWIFSQARRVPGSKAREYLSLARLVLANGSAVVNDIITPHGAIYDRLWHPVLLSALNTDLGEASAKLAGAVVRETLAKGGAACRPLVATEGLGPVFIDPAIQHLKREGVEIRFDHQLRRIAQDGAGLSVLDFGDDAIPLAPEDRVILAVPAWVASLLLPGISAPSEFRSIVNLHYKAASPAGFPPIIGIVGGTSEWLFSFPGRLSVTISAADRFIYADREHLARQVWDEIRKICDIKSEMPAWQIVKERRATFAATPAENAKRPGTRTRWRNLALAGDWTATGLPATIEGAIRSGGAAAEAVLEVA